MKKIFLLLPAFSFLCYSCTQPVTETPAAEKPLADSVPSQMAQTTSDTTSPDYSKLGFDLMLNETIGNLRSGMPAEDVLRSYGNPTERSKIEMWEADGEFHQTWKYSGMELNMSNSDSTKLLVSMITLFAPSALQTRHGIGIGSSFAETEKAYHTYIDKQNSDATQLLAGTPYGGMIFTFEKGKLSRIFLGAASE